jgi:hypothetical protein
MGGIAKCKKPFHGKQEGLSQKPRTHPAERSEASRFYVFFAQSEIPRSLFSIGMTLLGQPPCDFRGQDWSKPGIRKVLPSGFQPRALLLSHAFVQLLEEQRGLAQGLAGRQGARRPGADGPAAWKVNALQLRFPPRPATSWYPTTRWVPSSLT